MSRLSLTAHPFLLGFEQVDRMLERAAKSGADSFPPYNIEVLAEEGYRITLAVAGFAEADLDVSVEDGNLLVISGRAQAEEAEREMLHRGIAARQFKKSFVLADGVEVLGARLEHGLLHVELVRRSTPSVVQKIEIDQG